MTHIRDYLQHGILPKHYKERRALTRQSARYLLMDEILYPRGFSIPLLPCVAHGDTLQVLSSVHEGECGDHTGGRPWPEKLLGLMPRTTLANAISASASPKFQEPHLPSYLKWPPHGRSPCGESTSSELFQWPEAENGTLSLQLIILTNRQRPKLSPQSPQRR